MALPLIAGIVSSIAGAGAAHLSSAAQMRFQERMSGTSHQREVEDLKKAGLNPMLSAMGGPGASTPSGSMPDLAGAAGSAVASAKQAMLMRREADLLTAQIRKVNKEERGVDIDNAMKEYMMGYPAGRNNQHMYFEDNELDARRRRALADARMAELGINEQQSISDLFGKIGKEGKLAQILLPLLLRVFRR